MRWTPIYLAALAIFAAATLLPPVPPAYAGDPADPNVVLIEGPIFRVVQQNPAGRVRMKVEDVIVILRPSQRIQTPTTTLTTEEFADPTSLPGRRQPGFVGGTAIITALRRPSDGKIFACDVFAEPAENILSGAVTGNAAGNISVLDIPVCLLADARMPGQAMNECGFEIDPATIPVDSTATLEGYFSRVDRKFYAFLIQGEGLLADPVTPQISVTLVRCDGNKLEVAGAVTDPNPLGQVQVFDAQTNLLLASVFVIPKDGTPFGEYAVQLEGLPGCPNRLRIVHDLTGATVVTPL